MNMTKLLAKLPIGPWRDAGPIVSVLRLSGVIGQAGAFRQGLTMANMAGLIERAFAPKGQAAVALVVNSPGGSPVQSALIAKRIRDLATEKKVPVFAFCEDAAASGGYWLACAADEIWADESSILGSIGVVSAGFGAHEFIERYGIERRLYTAGDKKVILDPFSPEREDGVAHLKAIQAEIHDAFKAMVRDRRGARLSGAEEELFSGAFWAGRRALELGLIDGIGDLRSVLRGRFGEKVRLRVVQEDRRWFRRMGFRVHAPVGTAALDRLAADLPAAALSAVEERALWSRYGL
ncbi:S49 family peptidase [Azospirillum argentinense]|uniref:S49 family peptidase n=2 Tax=Azospirillum TaxID=191 RepID=A0A4D8Q1R5_AZOBR|nr:S49 family peptidase [Azospirillum argentinense]